MKKLFLFFALVAFNSFLFESCKKDETVDPNEKGQVELEFDNVVGGKDLQLNTGAYTNASGEDFTVTTFNYYISNIVLTKNDGSTYVVPKDESYFLVKESDDASRTISLSNIPAGDYTSATFVVGVDSLKNTADIAQRTGVLDPAAAAQGMYWKWNSGYIFMKIEGVSTFAPLDVASNTNKYWYHIGGFGGMTSKTINNIKTVTIKAGANVEAEESYAKVRANTKPHFHIYVDAAKIFTGSTALSIKSNPVEMFTPYSVNIANNYANMFTLDHIHN